MRRLMTLTLIMLVAATSPVGAFGTIDGFGQHAEHGRITRWALANGGFGPKTMDQFAGHGGFSFGAVGAPDNPWRGLISVRAAHCDGGDYLETSHYPQPASLGRARLEACRAWMLENLARAVSDVAELPTSPQGAALVERTCHFNGKRLDGPKCAILEDMGLAFHALQDFYAHTNWTDHSWNGRIGPLNPPGLGHDGPSPWMSADRSVPFPTGLISGCFDGFPERFFCGAGGANAQVAHATLNKDEGPIDPATYIIGQGETARGRYNGNFQRAVIAAVNDTHTKWGAFEAAVVKLYGKSRGLHALCLLKSDVPTSCQL